MARSLVIVESPAKAKTINKYLGRNFTVKASIGHVMDLPKKTIGIRLPGEEEGGKKKKKSKAKKGSKKTKAQEKAAGKLISIDDDKIFEPTLQIIAGKGKVINDLRKAAITADAVYLAGDPDREGEAISAHLAMVLSKPAKYIEQEPSVSRFKKKDAKPEEPVKKEDENEPKKEVVAIDPKKIFRVTFNEITPKAIRAAFDKPRQVDTNLVDAQQARRVLDRIVGYKVSPILWDKVRRGLSAGRVQTVALRLIVEREMQIRAFVPQEYWTIHAMLDAGQPPLFEAKLFKHKGEDIAVSNQETADKIVATVSKAKWQVAGAILLRLSRLPNCSRRPTTGCATPPSARCPSRRSSMKAWSLVTKARSH
jgi:DNA topoisomerase-1